MHISTFLYNSAKVSLHSQSGEHSFCGYFTPYFLPLSLAASIQRLYSTVQIFSKNNRPVYVKILKKMCILMCMLKLEKKKDISTIQYDFHKTYLLCLYVFYMYLFNDSLEVSPLLLMSWQVASVSIIISYCTSSCLKAEK